MLTTGVSCALGAAVYLFCFYLHKKCMYCFCFCFFKCFITF